MRSRSPLRRRKGGDFAGELFHLGAECCYGAGVGGGAEEAWVTVWQRQPAGEWFSRPSRRYRSTARARFAEVLDEQIKISREAIVAAAATRSGRARARGSSSNVSVAASWAYC